MVIKRRTKRPVCHLKKAILNLVQLEGCLLIVRYKQNNFLSHKATNNQNRKRKYLKKIYCNIIYESFIHIIIISLTNQLIFFLIEEKAVWLMINNLSLWFCTIETIVLETKYQIIENSYKS